MNNKAIIKGCAFFNLDWFIATFLASFILALSCYSSVTILSLIALPAFFLLQKNRVLAWLFILLFYLVLNIEEIPDTVQFFTLAWPAAVGLWLIHALFFSLVWLPFYHGSSNALHAFLRTLMINGVLVLPPFGFLVWMQPITISGFLFPGTRGLGIIMALLVMGIVSALGFAKKRFWLVITLIGLATISLIFNFIYRNPPIHKDWVAINTHLGASPINVIQQTARQAMLIDRVDQALDRGKKLIILPENMTEWLSGTQRQWQLIIRKARHLHAYIFLGRVQDYANGSRDAGFEVLGGSKRVFLPERVPMPLGEWNPFSNLAGHYQLHWLAQGVYQLEHWTIAYLICYEQMVPYPFLRSFLSSDRPNVIISSANQWFALKSGYRKQTMMVQSFARLFGVPLLIATNC